jgi:hypothetical protein
MGYEFKNGWVGLRGQSSVFVLLGIQVLGLFPAFFEGFQFALVEAGA